MPTSTLQANSQPFYPMRPQAEEEEELPDEDTEPEDIDDLDDDAYLKDIDYSELVEDEEALEKEAE